jgi:putative chitinase
MIAYMLATTWHETSFTFRPIKEVGSNKYLSKYDTGRLAKALGNTLAADGDGILYAGRGYVMITGRRNYDLFTRLLGVNLIDNPDLALKPEIASAILIIGSLKGLFTTRGLTDFIKYGSLEEFKEARRVINGTDANTMIASYAKKFVECIKLTKI